MAGLKHIVADEALRPLEECSVHIEEERWNPFPAPRRPLRQAQEAR